MRPRNGPPLAVSTMRATSPSGGAAPQALVHRAVLAVDGHELRAGGGPRRLHDRARRDEALLVREGQAAAGAQRAHGDGKPREADDGVDDDVGRVDKV